MIQTIETPKKKRVTKKKPVEFNIGDIVKTIYILDGKDFVSGPIISLKKHRVRINTGKTFGKKWARKENLTAIKTKQK